MIFRLSCRQLRRNILESIVVWLQLFLTVLIITEIGTQLINANFAINSVHTTRFDELSYYSERNSSMSDILEIQESGASQEEIRQLMEQRSKRVPDLPIMQIFHASLEDVSLINPLNNRFPSITVVDKELAVRTSLPLSAGEWFDPQWDESQGHQALVSTTLLDHFEIGKTYTIPARGSGLTAKDVPVTVKIVGALSRDNYSYPSSVPLGNDFLEYGFYGLVVCAEEPEAFAGGCSSTFGDSGYIVGHVSEELPRYTITPVTQKLQEFTERQYADCASYALLGGIVIALALFGICCSTIIKTGYDTKRYAIMSFCGARWRDCVLIELWKTLIIYLTSMAAASLILWVVTPLQDAKSSNQVNLSPEAFWIGIAAAFLLYIPAALWKVWHVARQNPIEVIKED
ncbi:MAG: ABC transporter permease [Clostridia bacterium]